MVSSATVVPAAALDTDQTIGLNVYGLLYRRKSSQKELAATLGVTPSVLSKKLRGASAWSARQVALTAEFLGTDPGRLFQELSAPKVTRKLRAIAGTGPVATLNRPLISVVTGARRVSL